MSAHVSTRQYVQIWVALAVLLFLGAAMSQFPLAKPTIVVGVLTLSTIKAALVVLYYMHLKFDHRWLAIVAAFPLVIIALAVGIVLSASLVRF